MGHAVKRDEALRSETVYAGYFEPVYETTLKHEFTMGCAVQN